MKIDFPSGSQVYCKNVKTAAATGPAQQAQEAGKVDVLDFSHGKTAGVEKDLLTLKAKVHQDVSSPADPQRVEELRNLVKTGAYRVSTEDIVNAILQDE